MPIAIVSEITARHCKTDSHPKPNHEDAYSEILRKPIGFASNTEYSLQK